jgi:hypothetical protein
VLDLALKVIEGVQFQKGMQAEPKSLQLNSPLLNRKYSHGH